MSGLRSSGGSATAKAAYRALIILSPEEADTVNTDEHHGSLIGTARKQQSSQPALWLPPEALTVHTHGQLRGPGSLSFLRVRKEGEMWAVISCLQREQKIYSAPHQL